MQCRRSIAVVMPTTPPPSERARRSDHVVPAVTSSTPIDVTPHKTPPSPLRAPDIKVASVTSRGGDDVTVTSPPPPPPAVYDVAFTSAAEKTTTTTTFAYSVTRCLRTVARPSCDISSSGSSYLHVAFTTVHRLCNCRSSVVRTPPNLRHPERRCASVPDTYIVSSSELCSTICCLYVVLLRRNKR